MQRVLVMRDVGKRFRRFHPDRPTTLQEAIVRGLRQLRPAERFWALRGISVEVEPGAMLGIVGANGAGKTTLLRLISGVVRPDQGMVRVEGHIGALLDLGAGFHPDLTGRENLFINGVISGLTRREVAARFDEIVAFAELERAIESPLRTYSSGMQLRLAFAVAVHTDPTLLLIDEVLAVGDIAFQQKCLARIAAFRARGCAIVLVSHDTALVATLCDQVLWLHQGRVAARGPAATIVERYVSAMTREPRPPQRPVEDASGSLTGVVARPPPPV